MEESDANSLQAIEAAISFFGHANNNQEIKKEREVESLLEGLGKVKVQLEAKVSAHKQSLVKLDLSKKAADQLSTLLRKCDSKKQFYINECEESHARVTELESTVKQMAHQLTESETVQEQLSRVLSDLVSAQAHMLDMEAQIAVMREVRGKAVAQAEAMEGALNDEKQRTEVLMRQVSETSEIIFDLKKRVLEVEREKASAVSEKEAELELAAKALAETEKQADCAKRQLEVMHDLEGRLSEKMSLISSLQVELNQAKQLHVSSQKAVADAISELKRLEEDLALQEGKNLGQADRIRLLESELKQSKAELGDAHAEVSRHNEHSDFIKSELEKERVEVALLKFELHKAKSKLAAAEARVQSEKSALLSTLQQQMEPTDDVHFYITNTTNTGETNSENRGANSRNGSNGLIMKDALNENGEELESMKRELELAMSKIGQLRTRAQQAVSRAGAAEKAKAALEDQMRRMKEHNIAPKEESISWASSSNTENGNGGKNYHQPLAKVIDMKF